MVRFLHNHQKLFKKLYYSWIKSRIPIKYREPEDIDLTPIFIIGTNRSGTSIVTSLFSQHQDLEGIFSGHLEPTFNDTTIHSIGYCESEHIWPWLRDSSLDFFNVHKLPDAVLWGHPKYISKAYRDNPYNRKETLAMANAISQYRNTAKHPLIKDQFNLFRIGLIKKAIPLAKFVLVIRDYNDYFQSCKHKWFTANGIYEHRSIAAHWISANTVGYGDLQEYALNDHVIINYNELLDDRAKAQGLMNNACNKLGLADFNFNMDLIDNQFRYHKENTYEPSWTLSSFPIDDILTKYRKLNNSIKINQTSSSENKE